MTNLIFTEQLKSANDYAKVIETLEKVGYRVERREEVSGEFTRKEAEELDRLMCDHMYHHHIANNINSMSCGPNCRTEALHTFINRILKNRDTGGYR